MESPGVVSCEGPELVALWQQLGNINSAIECLDKQAGEIKMRQLEIAILMPASDEVSDVIGSLVAFFKSQAAELRMTTSKLEDVRDSIRATINEKVRPRLRPLNILHLPDELLVRIFSYVGGGFDDHELYCFDQIADAQQIKSLRQTCRRFCETSSDLLLCHIKVNMTQPSIARLEEISQHPTISRGLRAVQVILCFYDSVLATNFHAFAIYQASRLRSSIRSWHFAIEHLSDIDHTPEEVYRTAIAKALSIAESWEDAARHGSREDCSDHALLQRAQKRYKQCYEDQKILQQGSFAQAIASAMTRMPRATWLELYDYNHCETSAELLESLIFPKDIDEHELLLEKLTIPLPSWEVARDHGLGQPPAEVIPRLLSAMHEEAVWLTGLKLWISPPEDSSLLLPANDEKDKFNAAVKYLKALDFHPQHMHLADGFWNSREPDEWKPFSEFLSALLGSTAIQRVSLDFNFLYSDTVPPSFSMGPIVLSHQWPMLDDLDYSGPFHLDELQEVVRRAKQPLLVIWRGDLMSGTWAELLDFFKESVSKGIVSYSSRITTGNGRASGAECEDMTEEERKFIFDDRFSPCYEESLATSYIRGWLTSNPVRDWELGNLLIPEES